MDKKLKELRQEYINELFNIKNKFERKINSKNEDMKKEAYLGLLELVKKYVEKMVRMEKNKYMRERVYYQRNNEIAMYEQANKLYLNCRKNVEDNLIKQAKTICKPDEADFKIYFGDNFEAANFNAEFDDITQRISEFEARKYYDLWLKIKVNFEADKEDLDQKRRNGTANEEEKKRMAQVCDVSAEEAKEVQKDQLFIESGEDVEDLFLAFKHYKLQ